MSKYNEDIISTCLKDLSTTQKQVGTPTMVLLPAQNYAFKVKCASYTIEIPREGTYHAIDPEFFSEQDGEFSLLDTNSNVLYMPSISKVLFAAKKYPDLAPNELFAPVALIFSSDKVKLVGQVLEMEISNEK